MKLPVLINMLFLELNLVLLEAEGHFVYVEDTVTNDYRRFRNLYYLEGL